MLWLLPLDGFMSVMAYCTPREQHRMRATCQPYRELVDEHVLRASYRGCTAPRLMVWQPRDLRQLQVCSQATRQQFAGSAQFKTFVLWTNGALRGAVARYVVPSVYWPAVECLFVGWERCIPTPSEISMCTLFQRMHDAGARPSHLTVHMVGAAMRGRFARTLVDFLRSIAHRLHTCHLSLRNNSQMSYYALDSILRAFAGFVAYWRVLQDVRLDVRGMPHGQVVLGMYTTTFMDVAHVRMITDAFHYEWDGCSKQLHLRIALQGAQHHDAVGRILWCLRGRMRSLVLDLSHVAACTLHVAPGRPFAHWKGRPAALLWVINHQLHVCVLDEVSIRLDARFQDVPAHFLAQTPPQGRWGCLTPTCY